MLPLANCVLGNIQAELGFFKDRLLLNTVSLTDVAKKVEMVRPPMTSITGAGDQWRT